MQLHSFVRDGGIKLLDGADDLLQPVLLGNIIAHNLVRNPRRKKVLDNHIAEYFWHRRMMSGFMMRTVAAEVESPEYRKSLLSTSGRAILNGAAGNRARNHIRGTLASPAESTEYFRKLYSERIRIPAGDPAKPKADECWIDVKNFHNFFHFMTESFHQAFVSSQAVRSAKKIVLRSSSPRVMQFVDNWINDFRDALGKDVSVLAGARVDTPTPASVIMPLSAKHLLYQFSGRHDDMIAAARPPGRSWTGYDATVHPGYILGLNAFDDSLAAFRTTAIRLAKSSVSKKWGRKIYVRRSTDGARKREMKGEDLLADRLKNQGFEIVFFENLTPLEQISCVNNARCIVMQHGAGMANMLFASPKTHVFELGTYQTAIARWADFIPLCHAAQCHYHHIFLDMDFDKEDTDPVFRQDGLVAPVVLGEDVDRVADIITQSIKDKSTGDLGGLLSHFRQLYSRNAFRQAFRLFDASADLASGYSAYWDALAQLDEACGRLASAQVNLEKARRLREGAGTAHSRN